MRNDSRLTLKKFIIIICLLGRILIPSGESNAAPEKQDITPLTKAEIILERLSPEEKVGQLFLINYFGDDFGIGSEISELIAKYHIGGVVINSENENFPIGTNIVDSVWEITNALQHREYTSSFSFQIDPNTGENFFPTFIPIFFAINQNGNGYPSDTILEGLTPLPSQMAIGATWDTELSKHSGEILGRELSTLGINLLLGPSLNVLENPNADAAGDLKSTSFGGDPFWVSKLGQTFIEGVHLGSDGKITVVVKNFPGYSGSENLQSEEIPTISKALEQLIQIELQPFYSVTGLAENKESTADGVLLSHARYQGLQGNISSTTRPISLDEQAISELMSLPEVKDWYSEGGLIVSDNLGSNAIRKFYDPTELVFNIRSVAIDSFLAGNDLLNLGNSVDIELENSFSNITETLSFFAQKYQEDITFAQQVDDSVLKILSQKFEMYPTFILQNVSTSKAGLGELGLEDRVIFDVAIQSATLLSPIIGDLDTIFPAAPSPQEKIIIITDTTPYTLCEKCEAIESIEIDALQKVIERLYEGGEDGLLISDRVQSFSFSQLEEALNSENVLNNKLINDVRSASWVIFLAQNQDSGKPETMVLSRLLSEQTNLLQNKNTIVFAVDAPYYLDATEISKISVYFGIYSKQPQFIEVMARLLFKELTANGASPVNIDGIGYDLNLITSPDPVFIFPMVFYPFGENTPSSIQTQEDLDLLDLTVGDPIRMVAGPIIDFNGNIVPDGTPIELKMITDIGDGSSSTRTIDTFTQNGSVYSIFRLENSGTTRVFAINEPSGSTSIEIKVEVGDVIQEASDEITPSEEPAVEQGDENNTNVVLQRPLYITLGDWLLTLIVAMFISLFSYQVAAIQDSVRWGIRWGLTSLIGGLVVLVYFAFDMPGTEEMINFYDIWGIVGGVALGAIFGLALGWLWKITAKK